VEIDISVADDEVAASKPRFSPDEVIKLLEAELPHVGDDLRQHARIQWEIGRIEEEVLRRFREARTRYRAALDADPTFLPAVLSLRVLEARSGNHAEAVRLFEQQISMTRDDLERAAVCVDLGRLFELVSDPDRAVATYRRALEIDPGNRDAIEALISLHLLHGQWVSLSEVLLRGAATSDDPVRRALLTARAALVGEVKLQQEGPTEALLTTALRQCPRSTKRARAPLGAPGGRTTDQIEIAVQPPGAGIDATPDISATGADMTRLGPDEPLGVLGPAAADLARLFRNRGRWQELAQLERSESLHADSDALRALVLYRAGRLFADLAQDPAAAEDCFEAAARLQPDDVLALLGLIEIRAGRGDASALERTCCDLLPRLGTREQQVAGRFEIARLRHERLGRTEAAVEALREALQQDPHHVPSLRALEDILLEQGRFEDLIAVARAEVDRLRDPRARADAYYELGHLAERHLAAPDTAALYYRTVLDLVPGHATALEALDRLYTEREDWPRLVDLLEAAAKITPDRRRAAARLVRAAQLAEHRLDAPERAIGLVEKLLEVQGDDLAALGNLGRLLERTGRWEQRIAVLRREVTLVAEEPERLALMMCIGTICEVRLDSPRRARDVYREVITRDPGHHAALRAIARIDRREGRFEDLLATLQLELGGLEGREAAVVHIRRGHILEDRLGKPEAALECYRAALEASPGFRPAVDSLHRLLRQLGRWDDLASLLREEARRGGDDASHAVDLFRLGELCEHRLSDAEGARRAYFDALKLAPGLEAARDGVLRLLEGKSRWAEVADALDDAAARNTGRRRFVSLVRLAALRAWRLDDPKRAVEALEKAAQLAPWDLAVQDALVQVCRTQGLWERLRTAYPALAKLLKDPRDAAALLHRAALETRVSPALGDEVQAYRAILEIVPGDVAALSALESIAVDSGDDQLLAEVTSRLLSVESRPDRCVPLLVRQGNLKAMAGDEVGASRAFKRALDLDGSSLPAIRGLAVLAAAGGRHDALADLKEQEAVALRDTVNRTRALMEAGEIRLGALKQTEAAARCFSAVLALDPGHRQAFTRLSGILESAGRWAELAEAIRLRLGTSVSQSEQINLRLRLSLIEREKLGALESALHTLEGLLKLEPDNRNALESMGEILAALERWREAASVFECAIDAALARGEKKAVHRCRVALAGILIDRLGELDQAVNVTRAALEHDSRDLEAFRLLVAAERRRGDHRAVASALDELSRLLPPGQRSPVYLELAGILLGELGERALGAEALEQAVVDAPREPEPLRKLVEHHASRGDWEGLARALTSAVEDVTRQGGATDRIRVELATTLIEKLGLVAAGVEHLEVVLRASPGHPEARFAMARRHMQPPGRPDLAEQQYRAVLVEDPWNMVALRGLFRLLAAGPDPSRARLVAMLLAYFGDQEATGLAGSPGSPGRRALGPDGYHRWVASPAEPPMACQIFRVVQSSLSKVYPPDLERHGATRDDRRAAPDPLALMVDDVAQALGLEAWETFVSQRSRHVCVIEPGEPPKVIVGIAMQAYPARRRRFEIGRIIGTAIGGSLLFAKVPRREVPVLYSAVIGSAVRGYARLGDPGEVAELTRMVSRSLSRRSRKQLEEIARSAATAEPPDIDAWMASAASSAERCGLLACADIATALNAVRSRDEDRSPQQHETVEQRLAAVRGHLPSEGLARYWLSPACEEALSQIGSA
jgi:tetratricopeptide (TPR) repeat protein